jgi:hypothetical protein
MDNFRVVPVRRDVARYVSTTIPIVPTKIKTNNKYKYEYEYDAKSFLFFTADADHYRLYKRQP